MKTRKSVAEPDTLYGKLKGELLEKMENMNLVDQQAFNALIEQTAAHYKTLNEVAASELDKVAQALKDHWTDICKDLKK